MGLGLKVTAGLVARSGSFAHKAWLGETPSWISLTCNNVGFSAGRGMVATPAYFRDRFVKPTANCSGGHPHHETKGIGFFFGMDIPQAPEIQELYYRILGVPIVNYREELHDLHMQDSCSVR